MWTLPFTTIEGRGCFSAWTFLGCSSTFLLGNSCFRVREAAKTCSTGKHWLKSLLSRVCSCLFPCPYFPNQSRAGFWVPCPWWLLSATRYVWGVGLTFFGEFLASLSPQGIQEEQGDLWQWLGWDDEPHNDAFRWGCMQGFSPPCALWHTDCRADPMRRSRYTCLTIEDLRFLELL